MPFYNRISATFYWFLQLSKEKDQANNQPGQKSKIWGFIIAD